MASTFWINSITGEALQGFQLAELQQKAHMLYAVNGHIFEDEAEALTALGAVPAWSLSPLAA